MNKIMMVDSNNRKINYLRLSITDRCNLRCMYCMPEEGIDFLPHENVLSYEEILRIVKLATYRGIRKVRLTGGEPLVRKGFTGFLKKMSEIEGLEEISITTNGVLLKQYAAEIQACGVNRLNISLDSLKPEKFKRITGRDFFYQVWEGIQEAERLGFSPIKLNVVAIKGVNDDEIEDFGRLTLEKPYHIRFIEHMPIGGNNWNSEKFLSILEIYERIQNVGPLVPIERRNNLDGPAQRYKIENAKGEIGLIGALSNHFCAVCNRLRLTADGHLRSCLFSETEIDVMPLLREGKSDEEIIALFEKAISEKPERHNLKNQGQRSCSRLMSSIGG
jgi:GTP 3',8-cyclase